ncbi:histone-lysine N-methyltransferase SETMAR [Trichonephila inaurata madagascariensis]|uniref:Histone-lysine N-methyltransferase SETMAR n=1 Tax=Trichonephila inaurata madagascariensis TaxID=2747483 RepID=A0A8X6XTV0_9ARAC|nr:histone-lysine N-methyltransferase SETMAR [Trichonephila inaurata madagascariensis]
MQVPLLVELKESDVSLNAQRYTQTLYKLHKTIKSKYPCILSSGVIILHDNASLHVTNVFVKALTCKKWEVLEHSAYSADLLSCVYHIFGSQKKSLISLLR